MATHVIEEGPGPHPVLDWAGLLAQRPGVPPSEPAGGWHLLWLAAAASALAHLLATAGGDPVLIPDRRVAEFFALVPQHPQTGEVWPVAPPVRAVPLAWDAWQHLAAPDRDAKPVGRSVPGPPDALPGLLPHYPLLPDYEILSRVLARLPEVRQPRVRAGYDRLSSS